MGAVKLEILDDIFRLQKVGDNFLKMSEKGSAGLYRFGFQGQEKDDEVFGSAGSSYTAEFWQYDSRVARRWNIDPVDKPWESSYLAFSGNPILLVDPNGDNASSPDNIIVNEEGTVTDIEKNDKPNKLFRQDNSGNRTEIELNDPANDQQLLGFTSVDDKLVHSVSDENINWFMEKAGLKNDVAFGMFDSPYFALASTSGEFDFSASQLWGSFDTRNEQDAEVTPAFFTFGSNNSKAFNMMDAGNWLWGHAGQRLGHSTWGLQLGANIHSLIFNGEYDSSNDQNAISSGSNYSTLKFSKDKGLYRAKPKQPTFIDIENSFIRSRDK